MKLASLTIFFPCRNEQAHVERLARQAVDIGAQVADRFEVLIVNDASSDDTGTIADRLATELPAVRVVHRQVSRGYGAALRTGFEHARHEWVFYTDGDGQFDFDQLPEVVAMTASFDIVSGYRAFRSDRMHRRLYGRCFNALLNMLLGLRLRDISCAYKLYPRRLFEQIALTSDGAMIDAETLLKAQQCGYRIGQIGVRHLPRSGGTPSGGQMRVIGCAFRELWRLRRQQLRP